MKLTESKLRQIIREEMSGFKLSREYQSVAETENAYERAKEEPGVGLKHVRSMLHAAEGITLNLEYSSLSKDKVRELQKAISRVDIIAEELQQNV